MSDILSMFDYNFLKPLHLPNGLCVATVARVQQLVLDQDPRKKATKKPVVFFEEFPVGLLLNKTNAKTIIAMYGRDANAWTGRRLTLYGTMTDYEGEQVDCIRVRPGIPPEASPARRRAAKPKLEELPAPALPPKPESVTDAEFEDHEEEEEEEELVR